MGGIPLEDMKSFYNCIDDAILSEPSLVGKEILRYLKKNAMGAKNAKSWNQIARHLKTLGVSISKNTFQQTTLKRTREGSLFIGSTDRGDTPGYFIICDRMDAGVMIAWYEKRIQIEHDRYKHLMELTQSL